MEEESLRIKRKDLEKIEKLANEAIKALYQKNGRVDRKKLKKFGLDEEAINWGDLKCYDVQTGIIVYVDEASPDSIYLQNYIKNYIKEKLHLTLPVEVLTEW